MKSSTNATNWKHSTQTIIQFVCAHSFVAIQLNISSNALCTDANRRSNAIIYIAHSLRVFAFFFIEMRTKNKAHKHNKQRCEWKKINFSLFFNLIENYRKFKSLKQQQMIKFTRLPSKIFCWRVLCSKTD